MSTSNVRSLGLRLLGVAFPAMVLVALLAATMAQAATAKPPDAPDAPTVTATTDTLKVSWTEPADNGSTITGYNVRTLEQGDAYLDWIWAPVGTTSANVPVESKKTYLVDVQAVSSAGDGKWSPLTKAVTPANRPPGKPAPPTVTQSNSTATTVDLTATWEAPDNKGSKITSYNIRYKRDGSPVFTRLYSSNDNFTIDLTNREVDIKNQPAGTYQLQVQAVNSAGAGPWSDAGSGSAQVTTTPKGKRLEPAQPERPTVSATATKHVTIKWKAPDPGASPIVRYYIRARITGTSSSAAKQYTIEDKDPATNSVKTTVRLDELEPNKSYRIDIQAVNKDKDGNERRSAWSSQVSTRTERLGRPSVPQSVAIAADSENEPASTLKVTWKAPQNDGGSDIDTYHVRYKERGTGTYIERQYDNDTTSTVIEGLKASKTYEIGVLAKSTRGRSNWARVTGTTGKQGQPFTPAAPTVNVKSSRTISVDWDAPKVEADSDPKKDGVQLSDITTYEVRYAPKGSTTFSSSGYINENTDEKTKYKTAKPFANTTWELSGLKPNTSYVIQVRATNKYRSHWSQSAMIDKALPKTHGPPSTPSDLIAKSAVSAAPGKTASLLVTWKAPASDGGSEVSGYELRYRDKNGGAYTRMTFDAKSNAKAKTAFEDRSWQIDGLKLSTTYVVGVRAINVNYGGGSWVTKDVSTSDVPAAPAAPTVSGISSSAVSVKWANRKDPADSSKLLKSLTGDITYNLRYRPVGGTYQSYESASQFATIRKLKAGITYEVQVQAVRSWWDDNGDRKVQPYAWSNAGTGSTLGAPAAPADTAAAGASLTELTVTWASPASDGGAAVTGFNIEYKAADADADAKAMTMKAGAKATSATLKDLTAGTAYEVSVHAVNKYGAGSASKVEASTYSTDPPNAPAAPTIKVDSATAMTATWVEPEMAGSPIKGYDVRYRAEDGDYVGGAMWVGGADTTSVSLKDLASDTTYLVSVRAFNVHGSAGSEWSPTASATLGEAAPAEAPGKVTAEGMADSDTSLSITWTAAADGGKATGHNVRYGPVGGPYEWMWADADATSASITGLTSGTTYEVDVQATNKQGDGPWAWGGLGQFTTK